MSGEVLMAGPLWQWQFGARNAGAAGEYDYTPVSFAEIAGWQVDDHSAALAAFRRSAVAVPATESLDADRLAKLREQADLAANAQHPDAARQFFEENFQARHIIAEPGSNLVTGYFEPELKAALIADEIFTIPVLRRPDDLLLLTPENRPDGFSPEFTAGRQLEDGKIVPYYSRKEIESGVLAGRGLELAYLADEADAFVMHVQGSGTLRMSDGACLHIGFDGKNGYPYSSIGKLLIERGELTAENASLDAVLSWVRSNPERGRKLMQENRSYIFFAERKDRKTGDGPSGGLGTPLTAGRSLAIDPRFHQLGLPIWVSAHGLHDLAGSPFNRLMIAQDTGSAIRGPARGDIFWGSGAEAGEIAGRTKHHCEFCILIPN